MTRLNLGCGPYTIDGYDNLDAENGWRFQDGLDYPDGSVECITISHALMFLPLADWPAAFREFARVLEPGGVLRITEDATDDPRSLRHGGHPDAVTLTTSKLVRDHMAQAGLAACPMSAEATAFRDRTLLQDHHGGEPKVFFAEGIKAANPRERRQPDVRLTCIIPTIGRPSLGKAVMSAREADELIVIPNRDDDRGYRARNEAIERARGTHLIFLDDDDVYAPGAIGLFREAARQNPERMTIFRMRYSHGTELWNQQWLTFGQIGTPMLVVPNLPDRIGRWAPTNGGTTGGDYVFASETAEMLGAPVWREEVVALIRPS